MLGNVLYNEQGQPLMQLSEYVPPKEVSDLTARVKQDYQQGYNILHNVFEEFNDMSLIDRMNTDQKLFNVHIPEASQDPQENWRWNGVRPTTRNKIISIVAHLTYQIIFPNVFAQNPDDEEDKLAGEVMRDLIEWHIRNSDYELSFLYAVIAACVNPVSYLQVEFSEAMQTIKKRYDNGEIGTEEVIDEVLSGLHLYNVPADEILISNAYQFDLQKQRFIIRRKVVHYDELEAKYKKHKNWDFVRPGVRVIFSEVDGLFYESEDDTLQDQCEKVVYYNRLEDLEVCFINGVYFGEENVNANRIKHRTPSDRPRYNLIKFGYEPVDAKRFYFYKSAVHKLASDQDLIDKMWRLLVDAAVLEVRKPLISSGDDFIEKSVIYPGGITNVASDTEITPIETMSNFEAGFNILSSLEQSVAASSQDEIRQGVRSERDRTAYEISRIEQNAMIQLGLFGKMLAAAIKQLGEIMIDLIITHQTVGELSEISDEMKYPAFLLTEKDVEGNKKSKKIKFTDKFLGKSLTEEEQKKESYRILEEQGGRESDMRLIEVNPEYFVKLKFKVSVSADALLPRNEQLEKIMKMDAYDRMIQNPLVDQDAVTRDFLVGPLSKGKTDKYMAKKEEIERMIGLTQQQKGKQAGKPASEARQLMSGGVAPALTP